MHPFWNHLVLGSRNSQLSTSPSIVKKMYCPCWRITFSRWLWMIAFPRIWRVWSLASTSVYWVLMVISISLEREEVTSQVSPTRTFWLGNIANTLVRLDCRVASPKVATSCASTCSRSKGAIGASLGCFFSKVFMALVRMGVVPVHFYIFPLLEISHLKVSPLR